MASVLSNGPHPTLLNEPKPRPVSASRFGQFIFNQTLLNRSGSGLGSKVQGRIRRALMRADLLNRLPVTYPLHDFNLLMPLEHALPDYRVSFPDYGANLGRIARRVVHKYQTATIVDIGANIGDSAAIIRHYAGRAAILCIEPSEEYFHYLVQNAASIGPEITCIKTAVDASSGAIQAQLSAANGSARFLSTMSSERARVFSLERIVELLPQFAEPRLIKLDTDGFDGRILAGASTFLQRVHPVLFWEFDPSLDAASGGPGAAIFPMLANAGYTRLAVYTNTGDYLTTVSLLANNTLSDLTSFFSGRLSSQYADLCAFSAADEDLAEALREDELRNAQELRGFVLPEN